MRLADGRIEHIQQEQRLKGLRAKALRGSVNGQKASACSGWRRASSGCSDRGK